MCDNTVHSAQTNNTHKWNIDQQKPLNLYYKLQQIPKLKSFSSSLALSFAQSIEARR